MKCFIYDDGSCRLTERVTMQVLFCTDKGNVDLSFCRYAVIGFGEGISSIGAILFLSPSFERCAEKYASCVKELYQSAFLPPEIKKGD